MTENINQNILDEGSEWIRHTDQIWPHYQINNSLFPATSMINLPIMILLNLNQHIIISHRLIHKLLLDPPG